MRPSGPRLALALLLGAGAFWAPSRIVLMLLVPGCCRRSQGQNPVPLWAGPALSLLAWGVLLPLAGLAGLGPGPAGQVGLIVFALLLVSGRLQLAPWPRGGADWVPAGVALLLLGLRLVPLLWAVGPPGAEPAFHALVARRVLECRGWPEDLGPQAPGVPAKGFAPALAFLGAAGTGEAGPAGLPRSLLGLICLSQWTVDAGLLALGVALAGGVAGSLAATVLALAAPFPQDVSGWGGAGNLLALGAGLFFLAALARDRRPGFLGGLGWGAAAGAAHAMVAGLLALGLVVLAARRQYLLAWCGLLIGVGAVAGGHWIGSSVSEAERDAAAAWGRATGPAVPEAVLPATLAPARIARARLGTGVAGLALLGLGLATFRPRFRPAGSLGPVGLGVTAWLLLTGLPGRVWPALELLYPERVLLILLPLALYGLAVTFRVAAALLKALGRRRLYVEAFFGLALAWWAAGALRVAYVEVFLGRVIGAGLLAPSDLAVLERMSALVPEQAVVATRHDDAGLWVPALAGRRATCCHTVPALHEEMRAWAGRVAPEFSFLGARPDRGLSAVWTTRTRQWSGGGRVVFRRGDSVLSKLAR